MAVTTSSMPSVRWATVLMMGWRHSWGSRVIRDIMARMSRKVASAPSRSDLLMTKTSATSRMPALTAWMPSPMPGASRTRVVSARPAIATSA